MSQKSRLFLRFARPYVRWRLRSQFSRLRVRGLNALRARLEQGPLLLAMNHVAWWDPLVLVLLDERLGGQGACLMDAANLARFPFFSWAGALSLDRSRARAAHADLLRAAEFLNGPGRFLIVFPQGRQRPAHFPLQFERGIALLRRRTELPVVPVGLRYDFGEHPKAEVYLSIGEELPFGSGADLDFLLELEEAVGRELSRIDEERDCSSGPPFLDLFPAPSSRLPRGTAWLSRFAKQEKR